MSGLLTGLLALAALFLPVPYVALGPGEADDVLGADPRVSSEQIISITPTADHPTFPTTGRLLLTTVSESSTLTMGVALVRWLSGSDAVVPERVVRPPQRSQQQQQQVDRQDMVNSQDDATVAALRLLKVPSVVRIAGFGAGSKADGPLRTGDQLVSVGGTPVPTLESLRSAVGALPVGQPAVIVVRRGGREVTTSVVTSSVSEGGAMRTVIGANVALDFAVQVRITLSRVGGPSAGLMYSLGIVDKLTPGQLTGGRTIAGTGTIDPGGSVGIIGGIQQKLRGARQRGATVFLVPAGNCGEARSAGVSGLQLVRVPADGGLAAAYDDLQRLARGDTALPPC